LTALGVDGGKRGLEKEKEKVAISERVRKSNALASLYLSAQSHGEKPAERFPKNFFNSLLNKPS